MFEVAGGVRCRGDVAQRRGYSDRRQTRSARNDFASTGKRHWRLTWPGINASCYPDAIRDSRIATFANKLVWAR